MKFGRGYYSQENFEEVIEFKYNSDFSYGGTRVGLPVWNEPLWKGTFYPAKLSSSNFLSEYSKRLNCVEVSSTFYADVSDEKINSWRESVSPNFHFLPKWPQMITHVHALKNCQKLIKQFVLKMQVFGENLGTTLLQLPPQFSRDYKRELFYFLCEIPDDFPLTIEFRHESWFQSNRLYPELEEYLHKNGLGMTSSDTPGKQSCFHTSFTGSRNMIRYLSDEVDKNDQERLAKWAKALSEMKSGGQIYFILHKPENEYSPELIKYLSNKKWHEVKELNLGSQQDFFMT